MCNKLNLTSLDILSKLQNFISDSNIHNASQKKNFFILNFSFEFSSLW